MKKQYLLMSILFISYGITACLFGQIVSISPDTVEQGRALDIEVTAENIDFTQGTNVVRLRQGNTEIVNYNSIINSPTSLTSNFSFNTDHPTGHYEFSVWSFFTDITLTWPDGFYLIPDLTVASLVSISPNTAKQGEVITVTILGTNTNFAKNEVINIVWLKNSAGQINAISTEPIDSVTIKARFEFTYAHPIGTYSAYIKNAYDGTHSMTNAFELIKGDNPPSIISITPETIVQGQTLDIEVTAENIDFTQGTNVVSLKRGDTEIYMNKSTTKSPTSLTVNFTFTKSHPIGYYDFYFWNTGFDISLAGNQIMFKENAIYLKSAVTGIDKLTEEKLLFFPNPADNLLYIKEEYDIIQFFDINGRIILEAKQEPIINMANLRKGIYIVKFTRDNKSIMKKLIIN